MYSGGYGFGNAGAGNFNNAAPQQQQQQAPQQGQQQGQPQQQQPQQQQQMMYNQQQQFAGMNSQGAFPGGNPQMMPGGMMQNPGMQQMAANGQMAGYQQQFGGSPYNQVQMNPQNFAANNFMMGAGGMQGFPMQQPGMQQTPQMMQQQRLAQQQPNHPGVSQVSTPQRPSSSTQGTPTNAMPTSHGQFQPPPPPAQSQTPTNFQQQPADQASTPRTPTFAQNQRAAQAMAAPSSTPMSPGTEARDKERFALLLDINHELLYESIQIQTSQQEIKKELAAAGKLTPERKQTEEELGLQNDYIQCMRRLQANLSYMAAMADRKPDTKLPPHPVYLTAPKLTLSIKLRAQPIVPEGSDLKLDPVTDREERDLAMKELYARLAACYPGVDPNKEPSQRPAGMMQKPGNPGFHQASPTTQKTPQMTSMAAPPNPSSMGS
ncbi:uncharacterized protein F5Z01DRAFT_516158 [Emericellopsis atlantica]|uniref:Uncharacterized protein n=1 Tax=Emericellopsis atlantica TaxID=2614577 RepID=A0A9P8CQE6_9HYPO|nr:uncharacterized protein F5Z01DRAFT_516158 [Emericellopsis atlantica]KAG9255839.1 hypothetical protein F5Z01DRAFT_516158 [Emericellopsis atlantica]